MVCYRIYPYLNTKNDYSVGHFAPMWSNAVRNRWSGLPGCPGERDYMEKSQPG